MRKRTWSSLLAVTLALVCLVGCGEVEREITSDPLAAYDGTWYMAQNGVACRFGEGRIYRDDLESKEGQTLCGVYQEVDGRAEANLADVGGVSIPRPLYIVETDAGTVLCDSPDGNGTVYFYRDAVAVLGLLEEKEEVSTRGIPELTPGDDVQEPDDPSPTDIAALEDGTPEPGGGETTTRGSGVWIPKSGTKYHSTPTCSGMKDPTQVAKEEAERRGYTPCKRCH